MAFDINNQADLTALKNEEIDDSAGLGYAAAVNDDALLELMNLAVNNPGGETGIAPLTGRSLWQATINESINAADTKSLDWFFSMIAGIDEDVSDSRADIIALNDIGLNSKLDAITRLLSRSEVLFSNLDSNGVNEFVVLSRIDLETARAQG